MRIKNIGIPISQMEPKKKKTGVILCLAGTTLTFRILWARKRLTAAMLSQIK